MGTETEQTMKIKQLPDVEILKNLFEIDENIPQGIRWRVGNTKRVHKGDPAGCVNSSGYFSTRIFGGLHLNHRIIYSITKNKNLTYEFIDHFDKNTQNNSEDNLRIASRSENQRNRNKQQNKSSKYIGVYFDKIRNRWQARIHVNKNAIFLGRFLTEEEAALAYNDYIIKNNLDFFNLNQIDK